MTDTLESAPTWATLIRRAIDDQLCDVHVALPGRVETYNPATQLAEIKPMIQRTLEQEDADGALVAEVLPVLPSVPVGFLVGGGMFVSVPVKIGDFGALLFSERSIDRFRATGEDVPPGDNRCHSFAGAFFVPGLLVPSSAKLADASATDLVIGEDGGVAFRVPPGAAAEIRSAAGSAEFLALRQDVQDLKDTIAGVTPVPNDGGAAIITAVGAASNPTGTTKLKAE